MSKRTQALATAVDPKVRTYVDALLQEIEANLLRKLQEQQGQIAQLAAKHASVDNTLADIRANATTLIDEIRAAIPQTRAEIMLLLKDAVENAPDDKHANAVRALTNAPVRHDGKAGT